jgi:hypothetical protein
MRSVELRPLRGATEDATEVPGGSTRAVRRILPHDAAAAADGGSAGTGEVEGIQRDVDRALCT